MFVESRLCNHPDQVSKWRKRDGIRINYVVVSASKRIFFSLKRRKLGGRRCSRAPYKTTNPELRRGRTLYICFPLEMFNSVNRFPTDQSAIATLSPDTPASGRIQQAKVITSQEPRDANDLRLSAGEVSYLCPWEGCARYT